MIQRNGPRFTEVWEEGQAFVTIWEQIKAVQDERNELENSKRKKPKKAKPPPNFHGIEPTESVSQERDATSNRVDADEQKEIMAFKINLTLKQEAKLV